MLLVDKNNVPATKREYMINTLLSSWKNIQIGFAVVFKKRFVTNALNGSDNHLVSDRSFGFLANAMLDFREEKKLSESPLPTGLLTVIKGLIPPKDIAGKMLKVQSYWTMLMMAFIYLVRVLSEKMKAMVVNLIMRMEK